MHRLLILSVIFIFGCAASTRSVTLSDVTLNPELYENMPIQFTGLVKENKFTGLAKKNKKTKYAKILNMSNTKNTITGLAEHLVEWELLITDGQNELRCSKRGYNQRLLIRGVSLAEEAKTREEMVTVTGRLISGIKTTPTIEIQKISYKDKSVDVKEANTPYFGNRHARFKMPRSPGSTGSGFH